MTKDDLQPLDKELYQYVQKMSQEMELALIEHAKTLANNSKRAEKQRHAAQIDTEQTAVEAGLPKVKRASEGKK